MLKHILDSDIIYEVYLYEACVLLSRMRVGVLLVSIHRGGLLRLINLLLWVYQKVRKLMCMCYLDGSHFGGFVIGQQFCFEYTTDDGIV